jgi:hypothetical protein
MSVGEGRLRNTAIAAARQELALTAQELWLGYVGVGGNRTLAVVRTWLVDGAEIPDREYDFLAQALNDRFVDRGLSHAVPYSERAVW